MRKIIVSEWVTLDGVFSQGALESEENLYLMRLLDEQYTRTPFYGIGN